MVDFMFLMFLIIYLALNAVVGIGASWIWIWENFWIEQNFFGKICTTIFYFPAYVLTLLKYAVVFILFWVFYALAYVLQMLMDKVLIKLFKKIKKLEL